MKTAEQILKDKIFHSDPEQVSVAYDDCGKGQLLEAMEEYADQYKDEISRLQESNLNDVSFHYATIESEMKYELVSQISDMIYHAIPTGEVDAFTLIKVLKKLKTDIEAL